MGGQGVPTLQGMERLMKGVRITSEDELSVPGLTAAEKKWIGSLQQVLEKCPKRLDLITIGDSTLQVVDREGARESEIHDGRARKAGIVLAYILGGPPVHATTG